LFNDYTNPKTFTALILTITDPHNAFKSFCLVFVTLYGTIRSKNSECWEFIED